MLKAKEFKALGFKYNGHTQKKNEWHFSIDAAKVETGLELMMLVDKKEKLIHIGTSPRRGFIVSQIRIDGIDDFIELSRKIIVFGVPLYELLNIV
jgi:hypothetical protein